MKSTTNNQKTSIFCEQTENKWDIPLNCFNSHLHTARHDIVKLGLQNHANYCFDRPSISQIHFPPSGQHGHSGQLLPDDQINVQIGSMSLKNYRCKLSVLAGFVMSWELLSAQEKVKIYSEPVPSGFIVFADNPEFCPVSMELDFKLVNLRPADESQKIFMVPPRCSKFKLTELHAVRQGRESSVAIEVTANFGDHNQTKYDEDVVYYLPYSNGGSYIIGQGYNGSFSHQNENCLDFDMPMGTEICAARGGVVCKVVESNKRHCAEPECMRYNNYIRIYHPDGTFAEYSHLKHNGAMVQEGDIVEIGQHIGYSGNTGWASGPHLHFVVFLQKLLSRETLKTPFLISQNSKPQFLAEKQRYTRAYD